MRDTIWEIFGYIIVAASLVLAGWEIAVFKNPDRDVWLVTPSRLRRRLLISTVLFLIGVLVLVEAVGILSIRDVAFLTIYLLIISGLALFLLFLAAVDAGETMRNASKHALDELNRTIEEEKARNELMRNEPGGDKS
jgi:hypothetical protein